MKDPKFALSVLTEVGRRSYQEDRYVALVDPIDGNGTNYFLAVLDGHRGDEVSESARQFLQKEVQLTTFEAAEAHLREVIAGLVQHTSWFQAGSTLSLACVFENHPQILCAVLGDSPIILGSSDELLYLSEEHNVGTNEAEHQAAIARGGWRDPLGYLNAPGARGGLQLTRALGNSDFGDVLSKEPVFDTLERPETGTLIVCSDGFVDPGHGESAVIAENLIKQAPGCEDVTQLSEYRRAAYGSYVDNATALMLKL